MFLRDIQAKSGMVGNYASLVIPAFVLYCVNGASRSSLLVESTDPMI